MQEGYQKSSESPNLFLFLNKISKSARNCFQEITKYVPKFFSLLTIFNPLIWTGFWIFPKIIVGNLRNSYHDFIVIRFSTSYFPPKIWILPKPKEQLRWIKKRFSKLFKAFISVKCKNNWRHKLWIWTKMESNSVICGWVGVSKIWLLIASF